MTKLGIIANPASGKDIRRLISSGSVFTNQEKVNIVVRMISALDCAKVDEVWLMPDPGNLARQVIKQIECEHTQVNILKLPFVMGNYKDTQRAVEIMVDQQFDLIIVMGGDGTSRIVAKHCQDIPIIAISTGTNNVFPQMVEGTLAGMAAAAAIKGQLDKEECASRAPILELRNEDGLIDIALVDLVIVDGCDIASRAVWETDSIKEVFLTQANADAIGLSAIGGSYQPLNDTKSALHLMLDKEGDAFVAPIAPGLMRKLHVTHTQHFNESPIPVTHIPGVVALDGERELVLKKEMTGKNLAVHFNPDGPWVYDIKKTLQAAAKSGFWRSVA